MRADRDGGAGPRPGTAAPPMDDARVGLSGRARVPCPVARSMRSAHSARISTVLLQKRAEPFRAETSVFRRLAAAVPSWLGTRQIAPHLGRREPGHDWFGEKAGAAGIRLSTRSRAYGAGFARITARLVVELDPKWVSWCQAELKAARSTSRSIRMSGFCG